MEKRNYDDEKENEEIGKAITLGIVAGTILVLLIVMFAVIMSKFI